MPLFTTYDNKTTHIAIDNAKDFQFSEHLIALPALIDPHVHFRTPGLTYKEDWRHAAKAALAGGYTTVFDMPNTLPPTITETTLREKKTEIDAQLQEIGIPLNYQLFFGADKEHLQEIPKVSNAIIGIKVFMGCSTGNLVIDDDESLYAVFDIAAKHNLLVAVHAEDEHLMRDKKANFTGKKEYASHSLIRDVEVATKAVSKAVALTEELGTKLYILHVSTEEEVALIKAAKKKGLPVFAETTPHHLFLDDSCYDTLQGKALVNPPLRESRHSKALFNAIKEGIIDTIGSDHAPHTVPEKEKPYGECPSGMPGIETTLALLLNAHWQNRLTLEDIVRITSTNARRIFNLPETGDVTLIDLDRKIAIKEKKLQTKCQWSPYADFVLQGWPVYTILKNHCYDLFAL